MVPIFSQRLLSTMVGPIQEPHPKDIFNLNSMYQPPTASGLVSHFFCNHEKGLCIPLEETDWEDVPDEWISKLQENLFSTEIGKELWKDLMNRGLDATKIIDAICQGVGDSYIDSESGKRESYRRRESETSREHARRLIDFFRLARTTFAKLKTEFDRINSQRDGPVVISSPDWPLEMEEFSASLLKAPDQMTSLVEHFQPIAHGRRKLNSHSGFMWSVRGLRRLELKFGEIATLLSAGYAIFGDEPIDAQEVRERLTSAEKLFGKPSSTTTAD
jgi:hypothetical protein